MNPKVGSSSGTMALVAIMIVLVIIVFGTVIYLTHGVSTTSTQASQSSGSEIETVLAATIIGGSALAILYLIVRKL